MPKSINIRQRTDRQKFRFPHFFFLGIIQILVMIIAWVNNRNSFHVRFTSSMLLLCHEHSWRIRRLDTQESKIEVPRDADSFLAPGLPLSMNVSQYMFCCCDIDIRKADNMYLKLLSHAFVEDNLKRKGYQNDDNKRTDQS